MVKVSDHCTETVSELSHAPLLETHYKLVGCRYYWFQVQCDLCKQVDECMSLWGMCAVNLRLIVQNSKCFSPKDGSAAVMLALMIARVAELLILECSMGRMACSVNVDDGFACWHCLGGTYNHCMFCEYRRNNYVTGALMVSQVVTT